jgi:hypothetical protein
VDEAEQARVAAEAEAARIAAEAAAAAEKDKPKDDDAAAEVARLQAELAARDARLATYDGLDPEAAKAAIAAKSEAEAARVAAERAKAEAEGNWERVRELMVEERDAREAKLKAEIDELRSGNQSTQQRLDSLTLDRAFSDSKFIRDDVALSPAKIRHLFNDYVDLVDGSPVVYDKPKDAKGRTLVTDGNGKALAFNDAIKKVIEADPDKDSMLKSDARAGAGSRGNEGGKAKTDAPVNRHQIFSQGFAKLRAGK